MPHTTKPAPLTLDPSFFTDPYAVYGALREEGPVRRVMLPNGWDVWVVTRYAEARAALADPRLRKDPRVLTEQFDDVDRDDELVAASLRAHMLNADPPDHTRLRRW